MSLFREPDAGNLPSPVRLAGTGNRTKPNPGWGDEAKAQSTMHRETTVAAPVLDSTLGAHQFHRGAGEVAWSRAYAHAHPSFRDLRGECCVGFERLG
jgi:hypothetical protein